MAKHTGHRDPRLGMEDEKATERFYRPVVSAWTRNANGREFCHYLEAARKPPRRSYIGLPVADPLSRWAHIWGTIATITDMTFTAFIVPLSVAFNDYSTFGTYWVMDYIGSIIYIMDLFFEFHIGFIVRWDQSSITITDGHLVAKHYVQHGTFWIDFIASLPIIAQIILSTSDISESTLRILLLLKLLRLVRVLKVLGNMNRLDSGGFIHQYLSVRLNSVGLLCWNLFYSLMVMVNLIACLWWWTAVSEGLDNSWVAAVQITKPEIDLENSSNWPRWLVCAYYALVTMATIGYGDIVPVTTFEVGMVIIMVLAGVAYFGFVLSTVSSIMAMRGSDGESSSNVQKYQAMEAWLRRFSVSRKLRTDIRRFVFSHGLAATPTSNDAAFYHALPLWLKVRVAEELQARALSTLIGSTALPKDCLSRVAQIAALSSDTTSFRPGERLHRAGEPIDQIIFLEEGELGLFVPGGVRPVRIAAPAVLGAGVLFSNYTGGEACATWHSSARAVTSVLLWRVDAPQFIRMLTQLAPEGLLAMMQHYVEWTQETIKRMQEAEAVNAATAAGTPPPGMPSDTPMDAAALGPGLHMAIERYSKRAEVAAAAVKEMEQYVKMLEDAESQHLAESQRGISARIPFAENGVGAGTAGLGGDGEYDESTQDGDEADLEGQAMAAEEQLERDRVRRQVTIQEAERGAGVLRAMILAGILRREGETTFVA